MVNGNTKSKRDTSTKNDNSRLNNSQPAVRPQDNGIQDYDSEILGSTNLQARPLQRRDRHQASTSSQARNILHRDRDQASTSSQARNLQQECNNDQQEQTNIVENEWKIAGRNRRRQRVKPEGYVVGSRTSSTGLSGVERVFDLFIGGCNCETNVEDIKSYCNDLGVDLKKVEILQTKSEWYRAFKISVFLSDRDRLMSPETWPKGIFIRKFYKARIGRNNLVNES